MTISKVTTAITSAAILFTELNQAAPGFSAGAARHFDATQERPMNPVCERNA